MRTPQPKRRRSTSETALLGEAQSVGDSVVGLVAVEEVGRAVVGQGVEVVEGRDSAGLTTSVGRSARAVNECWHSWPVHVGPHRQYGSVIRDDGVLCGLLLRVLLFHA